MLLSVFYLINESHRIDFILLELVWDIFPKVRDHPISIRVLY